MIKEQTFIRKKKLIRLAAISGTMILLAVLLNVFGSSHDVKKKPDDKSGSDKQVITPGQAESTLSAIDFTSPTNPYSANNYTMIKHGGCDKSCYATLKEGVLIVTDRQPSAQNVEVQSSPAPQSQRFKKSSSAPAKQKTKIIGNRHSKRYHLPGMKYYDAVNANHRVEFESEDDAIKAGYHKAPR